MVAKAEQAVILAAGLGRRMGGSIPKPLLRVAGREILYRTLSLLRELGVMEVILVVHPDQQGRFERFLAENGFAARFVLNDSPERGNGYSLHLARHAVGGKFLLLMGDHLYGEGFLRKALTGEGVVIDPNPRYADRNEATKVAIHAGRVAAIGKGLADPDAYDTGCFVLDPEIFTVTTELAAERGALELSDVVARARLPTHEVRGEFWIDVDTPGDLRRARRLLISLAVKRTGDGFVSRLLNRKISTWVSQFLVDHVTPWQVTWATFGVGLLAAALNPVSPVAAAVIYQLSSILDGVDGEIARAALRESSLGGWVDSLLDRYVDITYLLSLALVQRYPAGFWPVVALSLLGSVLVSYSTERFRGAFGEDMYWAVPAMRYVPGKRDERILLTMVLVLLGLVHQLFWTLAILTHLRVLLTLLFGYRAKYGGRR